MRIIYESSLRTVDIAASVLGEQGIGVDYSLPVDSRGAAQAGYAVIEFVITTFDSEVNAKAIEFALREFK